MTRFIAIAIAAGFASALLAASSQTGPGLGMILGFLSPLPLMIAAIGWHPLLALVGGALTSAFLVEFFGWRAGLTFALAIMIPTYVIARIIWEVERDRLVGAVVMAGTFYAALTVVSLAFTVSGDFDGYQDIIRKRLEFVLQSPDLQQFRGQLPAFGTPESKALIDLMTQVMPILSAFSFTLIYFLNAWLACRITQRAGLLPVSWTPVWSLQLPKAALAFAVVSILLAMLPGYAGFAAELIGNAAILSITVLGYACVHDVTRGAGIRGVILTVVWLSTFIFAGLPALLMLAAGIAELAFGWRGRILANRNP